MSERKEKFTPGPWTLRKCCDSPHCDRLQPVEAGTFYQGSGFSPADAHLIAAAPELYYENKRAAKKLQDVKAFLEANPETEWMTARWDGSECDGSALLDEVNAQIADLDRVSAKARGEA